MTSNYRRPFAPLQLAPGAAGTVCSDLLPVAGFVNEAGSDGVSARNTVVGTGLRLAQFTLAWAISRRDILMQNAVCCVFFLRKKVLHMHFCNSVSPACWKPGWFGKENPCFLLFARVLYAMEHYYTVNTNTLCCCEEHHRLSHVWLGQPTNLDQRLAPWVFIPFHSLKMWITALCLSLTFAVFGGGLE